MPKDRMGYRSYDLMSVLQCIVRTIVNNDLWIVLTKYRPGKCSYGKESHGITILQGTMRVHTPFGKALCGRARVW